MLQQFNEHILANFPSLKEKKLLIAISGGVDSVVLTYLLHKLNFNISLAHCNFQLRESDSDLDEAFINDLGKKLNIKTFTIRFDTKKFSEENKLSTQLAARKLRYDWFQELIKKHQFDYVLTAHHVDDNLETFLINLTRGTGLEGLTGIPEQNENIIRPLLKFSREDILNYANKNKIEWREDSSNLSKKYIRNKIRHDVIPVLKEINPNLLDSFSKTTEYLQQSQQIVNDRINSISEKIITKENDVIKFDIQKILKLSNPKAYLYQFLKKYSFNEWDKVFNLLSAQSGKFLSTKSHILLKNRDFLLFSPANGSEFLDELYYIDETLSKIKIPIELSIENTIQKTVENKKSILVDKKLVFYPLIIRKWKEGDVFFPTGMTGKKKVSKYFKDEKLSLLDKQNTWLLCTKDNQIIWIIGLRQDRRFTINNKTETTIKISI
ncbi:tRNA(Ile)-lysidine synthase [Tenacibaculum adriaticum]|uniref:tRNA(Ile)-lysidine synthase n=1 Tax=Tenacibaculum adriaticum TaxID=413713 RepID=A0A5S5DXA5_9FLAO|nr:tRNA lysidine(34) synthetase TilS [Tenacibaculum adriaticum]TYQ00355.1 tRNA(Ile)-lysidine synthase [Tenacibaculum adriaticum]